MEHNEEDPCRPTSTPAPSAATRFEQFQSFTDDALTVCPECEGRLRKVFNAVGVVFKGSGFYRTDSRDAHRQAATSKDSALEGRRQDGGSPGPATAIEARAPADKDASPGKTPSRRRAGSTTQPDHGAASSSGRIESLGESGRPRPPAGSSQSRQPAA